MSSQRFPVEAKAVGLLKHGKQKICLFSVSWSDQNVVIIYRAFEEFRKLHKTLKRKFPIERGLLRNSDRTIPKFPVVNVILWKRQKRSRCMKSLKQLEVYCRELLKAQPQISQGEDVIHFFEVRSQDLDPSFPENSNITFPSEMGDGKQAPSAWPSTLTITDPIVSPIYTCVQPFETSDLKNSAFRALQGESLEVLMKDRTGWWLVENNLKQVAWFPASYLEEAEGGSTTEETNEEGMLYYLTQSYEAQEADEVSVKIGVLVEVLEKLHSGWWLVWYNGKCGYVPSVFLQPYRNPHHKFLALTDHGLCVSSHNFPDVSALLSKASPTQQKHYHRGEAALWGRSQSCFLGPAATTASSGSLSGSLGSLGEQAPTWPPKAKVRRVGNILPTQTPQHPFGQQGSASPALGKQPPSHSGFDKELLGCSDPPCGSPLGPAHHSPPVPPRPAPHEILQKCSTLTKRAVQMALSRASPPACN